jgi:hypothetical protein
MNNIFDVAFVPIVFNPIAFLSATLAIYCLLQKLQNIVALSTDLCMWSVSLFFSRVAINTFFSKCGVCKYAYSRYYTYHLYLFANNRIIRIICMQIGVLYVFVPGYRICWRQPYLPLFETDNTAASSQVPLWPPAVWYPGRLIV